MKLHTIILTFFTLVSFVNMANALQGECSYYSDKYHGKATASGELYSKFKFTAASSRGHKFGTMLRVTNVKNGLSTVVKVNDIMGNKKRILDLSRAAAAKVGMIQSGVAQLKIEPISASAGGATPSLGASNVSTSSVVKSSAAHRLQYASFSQQGKALAHSGGLNAQGIMTEVIAQSGAYKVVGVRRFPSKSLAKSQEKIDEKILGVRPYVVGY